MARPIRNTAVVEALSEDARDYGIKRLAPELDKEPSSLYAELNPYGDRGKGKLGLDDAIEAMRIMGRFRALELAASSLGFKLVAKRPEPDGATVAEELGQDTKALGSWAGVVLDPEATETDVRLARQALSHELDETEEIKLRCIRERRPWTRETGVVQQ